MARPALGAGALLALPASAVAGPVAVDLSTVSGQRLGRLVGEPQGSTTYFLLADVARLANARTRPARPATASAWSRATA